MKTQIIPAVLTGLSGILLAVLTMSPLGFSQNQPMLGMPSPATKTPSQEQATSQSGQIPPWPRLLLRFALLRAGNSRVDSIPTPQSGIRASKYAAGSKAEGNRVSSSARTSSSGANSDSTDGFWSRRRSKRKPKRRSNVSASSTACECSITRRWLRKRWSIFVASSAS